MATTVHQLSRSRLHLAVALIGAAFLLSSSAASAQTTFSELEFRECIADSGFAAPPCGSTVETLEFVVDVAAPADGKHVYAADNDGDVFAIFNRNTATGVLTGNGCVGETPPPASTCPETAPGVRRPSALAVSPDGNAVFTASESVVNHFDRNPASGALGNTGCFEDSGFSSSDCTNQQDGLHQLGDVVASPDNRNFYAVSTGQGFPALVAFEKVGIAPLTPIQCLGDAQFGPIGTCDTSVPALRGVNSIAISPDGKHIYTTSRDDGAVSIFERDSSGQLTYLGCIAGNLVPGGCTTGFGERGLHPQPTSVGVSPDGMSVIVSSTLGAPERDFYALTNFARNPTTGMLTRRQCFNGERRVAAPCAETPEADLRFGVPEFTSDGTKLVTVDNTTALWDRDPASGSLTYADCIGRPDTGCEPRNSRDEDVFFKGGAVVPGTNALYVGADSTLNHYEIVTRLLTPRRVIADVSGGKRSVKNLHVGVDCAAYPCTLVASGAIKLPRKGRAATSGGRTFKLKKQRSVIEKAADKVRLKLKGGKRKLRQLRRKLRSKSVRRKSRAKVRVQGEVRGVKGAKTIKLKLKR